MSQETTTVTVKYQYAEKFFVGEEGYKIGVYGNWTDISMDLIRRWFPKELPLNPTREHAKAFADRCIGNLGLFKLREVTTTVSTLTAAWNDDEYSTHHNVSETAVVFHIKDE